MSKDILEIKDSNFKEFVKDSKEFVLVDFWAPWCGPCKMVGPMIEEIAKLYKGRLKIGKLNVDDNNEIATEFSVMSIPTLIFFRNGKQINRIVGVLSKDKLINKVEEIINS